MSMFFASCQNHGASGVVPAILKTTHPNLIAFYTFDNIAGSVLVDESANGNDGTINEMTFEAGKFGNACAGDAVNDSITIPHLPFNVPQAAISCWLKYGGSSANAFTLTNGTVNSPSYSLSILDRTVLRYACTISGSQALNFQSTAAIPSDGGYHHVVWQSDGTTTRLYVDGTEWAVEEYFGKPNAGQFMAEAFSAGSGIHTANFQALDRADTRYYNLPIDQFRAFNRVLTLPEISQLAADSGVVVA